MRKNRILWGTNPLKINGLCAMRGKCECEFTFGCFFFRHREAGSGSAMPAGLNAANKALAKTYALR
jgi:hypothetical protein